MNIQEYISKQLKEREELVRIVRRHPAVLVPPIGLGVALIIIDFFLLAWWFQHHWWGVAGWLAGLVIGGLLVARAIYVWSNNALAVTTQRVIDIDQRGFFERHVAEAPYEKIQDIRYTIKGVWPTILQFGTVIVQTAGTTTNLELSAVRRPVELQQEISEMQRRAGGSSGGSVSATELVDVVEQLKNNLGPSGVERLLRRPPPSPHDKNDA